MKSERRRDYTVLGILQARILEWVAFPFSRSSSQPGDRTQVSNTGVGSLSLLQELFPTRGSNPGLLHYRRILYQLSHKVQIPKPSNSSQFLRELLVHVYEKTHT